MWMMASEVAVRLETLDQTGQSVFGAMATLTHLDETYAVLSMEEPCSATRLHWGAPVRFDLEDGVKRYEITGAIVARHEDEAESGSPPPPSIKAQHRWDVRVRIWECKLNVQRRSLPRKKLRLRVRLRPADELTAMANGSDVKLNEISAWCVDIGAGGMRVRTNQLDVVPERIRVDFCVPLQDSRPGLDDSQEFCLLGRVIRAVPRGRHGDDMEIALCFDGLSVRDGLALHNLLA